MCNRSYISRNLMGKYPSHILVTWPGYDFVITSIMRSWTRLHEVFLTTGESQRGSYDQPYRQRLRRYFQPFYNFGEFCTRRLPCWHSTMLHMSLVLPSMPLRVLLLISGFHFPLRNGPVPLSMDVYSQRKQYFTFIRYSITYWNSIFNKTFAIIR